MLRVTGAEACGGCNVRSDSVYCIPREMGTVWRHTFSTLSPSPAPLSALSISLYAPSRLIINTSPFLPPVPATKGDTPPHARDRPLALSGIQDGCVQHILLWQRLMIQQGVSSRDTWRSGDLHHTMLSSSGAQLWWLGVG